MPTTDELFGPKDPNSGGITTEQLFGAPKQVVDASAISPYQDLGIKYNAVAPDPDTEVSQKQRIGYQYSDQVVKELQSDPQWNTLSPEAKQTKYMGRLKQVLPPELLDNKYSPDPEHRYGVNFQQGRIRSNIASFLKGDTEGLTQILGALAPSIAEKVSAQVQGVPTNPDVNNIVGRTVGTSAPLVAGSLAGGLPGLITGAAQGVGSARKEGVEQGWDASQTGAIAAERGIFNALIGKVIPGGKASTSLVGGILKGTAETAGLNIAQAGIEAKVRSAVGLPSDGVWDAVKKSASSGDQWAQSVLFGTIHGVVKHQATEPVAPEKVVPPTEAEAQAARDAATKQAWDETEPKDARRLITENAVRAIGGQEPLIPGTEAAESFLQQPPKTEAPFKNQNVVGPKFPDNNLTDQQHDSIAKQNRLRMEGGQDAMTLDEARKFVSQPEPSSVVGPDTGALDLNKLSPDQRASIEQENTQRAQGGQEPMTAEEMQSFVKSKDSSVVGPKTTQVDLNNLTPEQQSRIDKENGLRAIGGQDRMTPIEIEDLLSQEDQKSVVGPKPQEPKVETAEETPSEKPSEKLLSKFSVPSVEEGQTRLDTMVDQAHRLADLNDNLEQLRKNQPEKSSAEYPAWDKSLHDAKNKLSTLGLEAKLHLEKSFGDAAPKDVVKFLQQVEAKNPRRANDRSGFIDYSPIFDAAAKAGDWVGYHTGLAAHWAMGHISNALDTLGKFSSTMVQKFGEVIKPHLKAVWDTIQAVHQDTEGSSKPVEKFLSKWDDAQKVKESTKATEELQRSNARPWNDLTDRFEQSVNGKFGKEVVGKLRTVEDVAKRGRAEVVKPVDEALKAVSKFNGQASTYNDIQKVPGTETFVSNSRIGAEPENYKDFKFPEKASAIRSVFDTANRAVGKLAEGIRDGFQASGKMQRLMSPDMVNAILSQGKMYYKFVDGLVAMNKGLTRDKVTSFFDGVREDLVNDRYDAAQRKIAQEMARVIPRVPSGVMDGNNPVYFYKDRPVDYLNTIKERVPDRVAFKRVFGDQLLTEIAKGVDKEGIGSGKKFYDAVAAIHGMPLGFDKALSDPGSLLGRAGRIWNPIERIPYSAALLGASPHTAVGAFIGKAPQVFGVGRTLEGFKYIMQNGVEGLQNAAKLDRIITDLSFDKNNPIRSAMRITANALSIPNNWAHWLNGVGAAGAAQVTADSIRDGSASAGQRQDFITQARMFGFDKATAVELSKGSGSEAQYDAFVRKAVSTLTGRNSVASEVSKLENTKIFNTWFKAMRYPFTTLRVLDKTTRQFVEDVKSGDSAQMNRSAKSLVYQATGIGLSAIATNLVSGLLSGGVGGLKMAINENEDKAKNDTAMWLTSMGMTGIGGPMAVVNHMVGSSTPLDMAGMSYRANLLLDMFQASMGKGKYTNQDMEERWQSFGANRARMGVVANTWWGIMASGGESPDLDNAMKGLQTWKRDEDIPFTTVQGGVPDPEGFRAQMRRAVEAIKHNQDPSDIVKKALGAKQFADISESLKSRRLLYVDGKQFTPDQSDKLRGRIGDKLVDRLQDYDDTLSAWAMSYKMASTVSKVGLTKEAQKLVQSPAPQDLTTYKLFSKQQRQLEGIKNENRSRLGATLLSQEEAQSGGE